MNHEPLMDLIARDAYVDGILERLKRPDDVRESPADFPIKPGFYGQGGIGKTRLLQEIERRTRALTPYVVRVDLDRSRGADAPASPLALLVHLIAQLRSLEQGLPSPLATLAQAQRSHTNPV